MSELLDRDQILDLLKEVGDVLGDDGAARVIVLVGGALLAVHWLRDATVDVDSAKTFDAELEDAVAKVASRHDLAPKWLNSSSAPFRPMTLSEDDCEVIVEHGRLTVLGAPLRQVFLMKLTARAADYPDLVRLWPKAGFDSPEQAVEEYWQAYPSAPDDPNLIVYMRGIEAEAASSSKPEGMRNGLEPRQPETG